MLYKYLPTDRLNVIEDLKIRFSPLRSLNDPFESSPLIDASFEKEFLREKIETESEALWDKASPEEQNVENRKFLDKIKAELLNNLDVNVTPTRMGKELVDQFGSSFGVLSLSRTNHSLLMWSHYATRGKGFLIGFDESHPFFRALDHADVVRKPEPVTYTSVRKPVDRKNDGYYTQLLCRKPLEWAYEEEERIFRSEIPSSESIGIDNYGMEIVLSDLPKEAISEVYLGYHIEDDSRARILSAIKKNDIVCSIYDSSICSDEYRIVFHKKINT
jgi:hypothetical protein